MHTTACVRTSPPPLWGRTDSAEGRARRGVAGHGAPCRRSPPPCQPQGPRPDGSLAPYPAADVAAADLDQEPYARQPPSRSAFGRVGPPHKGEEECRRTAVIMIEI